MNKKLSEVEIEEKIRKINDAMSQEGMPLSDELKSKLYRCFSGDTTIAKERVKTLAKYNVSSGNYGRKK